MSILSELPVADAPPTGASELYPTCEVDVAYRRMSVAMQRLEDAISAIFEGGAVEEKLLDALRSDFAAKCTIYQTLSSRRADIGAHDCAEPLTDNCQAASNAAQVIGGSRLQQSKPHLTDESLEKVW